MTSKKRPLKKPEEYDEPVKQPDNDMTDEEFEQSFGKGGFFKPGNKWAWKKGQSGNPGGRPRHPKTMLRFAYLDALAEMDKSGLTVAEMIAVMMVRKAKKGDLGAMVELRKATEGEILNVNLHNQLVELAHQMGLNDAAIRRDPVLSAIFATILPDSIGETEDVQPGEGTEDSEESGDRPPGMD